MSDGTFVEVQEEVMIVSSKTRPDQPALNNIGLLSDWTTVDNTDHSTDHDDPDDVITNAFDAVPDARSCDEDHGEPITEDDVIIGPKVAVPSQSRHSSRIRFYGFFLKIQKTRLFKVTFQNNVKNVRQSLIQISES